MARPNKLSQEQVEQLRQLQAEYLRRMAMAEDVSPLKWAKDNGIARSTLARYLKEIGNG